MSHTLGQLATKVQGVVKGDECLLIEKLGTLEKATKTELSFLANPKYQHQLTSTSAGAVLVKTEELAQLVDNAIVVPNPYLAFAQLSHLFVPSTQSWKGIHPSAVISTNVIIADDTLRAKFAKRMLGLGMSPNSFGLHMATAAYSPDGAAWVDELTAYLKRNKEIFDAGINAIPGLKSMELEATYLAWVDFAGTGMTREEFTQRVTESAQIAANYGPTFGKGGETFLRFNLGAPRSVIEDAVARMQKAFADLQ